MTACWQCGHDTGSALFCPACNALQSPAEDYFELLGLPVKLNLSADDLQRRFYELSRQLHPDRFVRRSERERQNSLNASSILNDAYRTLRDPVKRAEYLLKQQGFDIGEQRSNNVPPELLEEVFELNMALEEMRSGDESARPQLVSADENFIRMLGEVDRHLESLYAKYDTQPSQETLGEIRSVLNRRKYIQNLVNVVSTALTP